MNKNFAVDEKAVCSFGSYKGQEFIVKVVLENGYSCKLADGSTDRYYFYNDATLTKLVEAE